MNVFRSSPPFRFEADRIGRRIQIDDLMAVCDGYSLM